MDADRSSSTPATGGAESSPPPEASGKGDPKIVDWFGLTESNVPPKTDEAMPPAKVELQGPSLCSIGGLRP